MNGAKSGPRTSTLRPGAAWCRPSASVAPCAGLARSEGLGDKMLLLPFLEFQAQRAHADAQSRRAALTVAAMMLDGGNDHLALDLLEGQLAIANDRPQVDDRPIVRGDAVHLDHRCRQADAIAPCQGISARIRTGQGRTEPRRDEIGADLRVQIQHRGSLTDVLQFTDVAWPGIFAQRFQGPGCHGFDGFALASSDVLEEMLNQ